MTAMACGHVLEKASGTSLKRLVRTLKKYREITLNIGGESIHAQALIPEEITTLIKHLSKPD